jgi:hypothetical protein
MACLSFLDVGGALSSANGLSDVRTGFSPHSVRKSPDRRYRTNSQNPPVYVGQPTNSMNKNTTTYPRARQHIQAAAFQDMLIQCVLLRALKQTPGGSSQYDGSHPPQTLSQIQLHRGPSNTNLFDRRAPTNCIRVCAFPVLHPRKT